MPSAGAHQVGLLVIASSWGTSDQASQTLLRGSVSDCLMGSAPRPGSLLACVRCSQPGPARVIVLVLVASGCSVRSGSPPTTRSSRRRRLRRDGQCQYPHEHDPQLTMGFGVAVGPSPSVLVPARSSGRFEHERRAPFSAAFVLLAVVAFLAARGALLARDAGAAVAGYGQ